MKFKYIFDKKNINKLLFVSRHNQQNEKLESEYDAIGKDVKVYGFYHAFCLYDGWEGLVEDQFRHLRSSGLYDRMERIYCTVIGSACNSLIFKQIGGANVK